MIVVFCGKPIHGLVFTFFILCLRLRLLEVVVAPRRAALEGKLSYHLVTVVVNVGLAQVRDVFLVVHFHVNLSILMLEVFLLFVRVEALQARDARAIFARTRVINLVATHVNLGGGLILVD